MPAAGQRFGRVEFGPLLPGIQRAHREHAFRGALDCDPGALAVPVIGRGEAQLGLVGDPLHERTLEQQRCAVEPALAGEREQREVGRVAPCEPRAVVLDQFRLVAGGRDPQRLAQQCVRLSHRAARRRWVRSHRSACSPLP